jgi:GNAT superfamily N-acetyltransferase
MRANEFLTEAFDRPYAFNWQRGDHGDYDVFVKLPDGSPLSIAFNHEDEDTWHVAFDRGHSQEVTGEGDSQRIFATVLHSINQFIKKQQPEKLYFSASKEVEPGQNSESRANLYDRMVKRYASAWGYDSVVDDFGRDKVTYILNKKQTVAEGLNEADASAVQFRTASTDNYQSSFTVTAIADGKTVGHFSFYRDPETEDVHNQAEVTDDVRGKGYGKALLLKAIEIANEHGLGFQEDSQSLSRAQSRVYDSLYDAGWIVDADGYWLLTHEGEQELARLSAIQQGVAEGRENYNGLNLLLQTEDDEVFVKASAGGRELGHVLFTTVDGNTLFPQDLEVDEKYQGQGIAKTMYDYVKSKGYRIRRSGQQTDAGAGFWNKHRPEQNVWESTADDINKMFNNMYDPMTTNLQRVALMAMQGRQHEAVMQLNRVIKDASSGAQKKITDAVNNIKPVTVNGKIADSSTLDKSKKHQDWILNTFIPWVQSLLDKQDMTEEQQSTPTMGINVRSDGNIDYAGLIIDGKKKYESRQTDSLRSYVGKTVAIVRTGSGPAVAIGQVTVGEPIIVDSQKFDKMRNQHLVPQGSKFDIGTDAIKYLYPMINPVRWDSERPVKQRGIVARKID